MVYIHGGAFIMGGGASYFFGPNYLLENDVVLVTFNYRYLLKIIKLRILFFCPSLSSNFLSFRNIYVLDKQMHREGSIRKALGSLFLPR